MRKGIAIAALAAAVSTAALGAAVTLGPSDGTASSHREAPLIADDPSADITDVYAFRSPDKPSTVTILANVIPAEDPAAGPNWYTFSPSARYNLKIDTTGDVQPDVIYRFQFQRKTGKFFLGDTAQPYTVTRIAKGRSTVVARGTTPPNNIGKRSTPNYRDLTTKSILSFDGAASKAFAGQRDDPFFGDIGAIFDLVAIRKGTGNMGGGKDFFAGYGVHTIGVQVPIAALAAKNSTIGVWASVDRRQVTTRGASTRESGGWVQVNRLGNPLVNEVIIPTGLKDRWNALQPWNESEFRKYYTEPTLAAVINQLYKLGVPEKGRDDLVAVLLTGVPKLNFTGPKLADVLRVNLGIPVTARPNRLGVLGGDNQGWPNGRRLGDDVIDIAEQAVGGFLKDVKLPLGDGVNTDDVTPLASFPYVADPKSGFDNTKGLQK
ncbi:MAG TPA: DUF4331 domain-containing protein [Gaiella sp.]|jgi:hypothetical protein|nr:DUF4331 domain-containing protein [Gaiella sp.]